ncbi:hypothetical protein [Streptomyces sp. SM14]|uniref:hypothetical protein n=1 Tax=Streptomyces sp. SM14 TaxID=1736045 RepID=UPI0015E173DC|nr:hypothetical protein [Streptomyces sp. SM14]
MSAHRPSDQLAEALRLLPHASHGRAAVTRRALPFVLLAQHLVTRGSVLLRIPAGQIESRVLDGTVLAYHAHPAADWSEQALGVQLVGTVTTVRPTDAERAAFDRSGERPARVPDTTGATPPAAEPGGTASGAGTAAVEDPPGTLYARLEPMLATVRHPADSDMDTETATDADTATDAETATDADTATDAETADDADGTARLSR